MDDVILRAWEELEPHVKELGYELVEVEFLQQGGRPILRLYIDTEAGIAHGDCQAVSRMAGPLLDAADFVKGAYALEVSSPGIDRPIRKPGDFERLLGEDVLVKTHAPVAGRRRFKGSLAAFEDGLILVACADRTYEVHIENLKTARLDR